MTVVVSVYEKHEESPTSFPGSSPTRSRLEECLSQLDLVNNFFYMKEPPCGANC